MEAALPEAYENVKSLKDSARKKSRISFHKVTKFHNSFIFKISTEGQQAVSVCPKHKLAILPLALFIIPRPCLS